MSLGCGDFASVLAELGRDIVKLQLRVYLLFRTSCDALLALQRRKGVFVQGESHVIGAAAQLNVVFLRAGEVQQGCAETVLVEQAHVDLQAVVEIKADFVFALGENLIDSRKGQNVRGDRVNVLLSGEAIGQREQKIEVSYGFATSSQRTRWSDRLNAPGILVDVLDDLGGSVLRGIEPKAPSRALVRLNRLQDVLFTLFAKSWQIAQLAFRGEFFHVSDGRSLEVRPQKGDLLRAKRLQIQNIE